jgi:chromosome segregation ATPase
LSSDEVQASCAHRLDEEKARHSIACASLEQAAAELERKQAQIEGDIMQEQVAHDQRMAVVSAPRDSLVSSIAEIIQEQMQLQRTLQEAEASASVAFESITLLRLRVEETGHHKVHVANQVAALLDARSQMMQALDDALARERAIDSEIAQVGCCVLCMYVCRWDAVFYVCMYVGGVLCFMYVFFLWFQFLTASRPGTTVPADPCDSR